jgi:outer membrane protein W
MKITHLFAKSRLASIAVVAAGFAIATVATTSVQADEVASSLSSQRYVGAVEGGVYINQDNHVRSAVGSPAAMGGLEYTINSVPLVSRTNFMIDYIQKNGNGNKETMIPILFTYQQYSGEHGGLRPYLTVGAGLVYEKVTDQSRNVDGSGSTFGAMIGYGADTRSQIYIEARYLLVPQLQTENLSGPMAVVGIRF